MFFLLALTFLLIFLLFIFQMTDFIFFIVYVLCHDLHLLWHALEVKLPYGLYRSSSFYLIVNPPIFLLFFILFIIYCNILLCPGLMFFFLPFVSSLRICAGSVLAVFDSNSVL